MKEEFATCSMLLLRQSPRALGTQLRFASDVCVGSDALRLRMDQWRDVHNSSLSAEQLKREGRVVAAALTPTLAAELSEFKKKFPAWTPLTPPWSQDSDGDGDGDGDACASGDGSAAVATLPLLPQSSPRCYVRQPTLHGDRVCFVSEGDLWVAELPPPECRSATIPTRPISAARLTVDGGCSRPCFSPDGELIAFGRHGGGGSASRELFVLALSVGSPPVQLTYLGDDVDPVGWSADGQHALFRSATDQPMDHMTHLFAVPRSGGRPRPLHLGIGHHLTQLAGGGVLVGRNTLDPAHRQWKGYRGGSCGSLWIGKHGACLTPLPLPVDWNLGHPFVHGQRVHFVRRLYRTRGAGQLGSIPRAVSIQRAVDPTRCVSWRIPTGWLPIASPPIASPPIASPPIASPLLLSLLRLQPGPMHGRCLTTEGRPTFTVTAARLKPSHDNPP